MLLLSKRVAELLLRFSGIIVRIRRKTGISHEELEVLIGEIDRDYGDMSAEHDGRRGRSKT